MMTDFLNSWYETMVLVPLSQVEEQKVGVMVEEKEVGMAVDMVELQEELVVEVEAAMVVVAEEELA